MNTRDLLTAFVDRKARLRQIRETTKLSYEAAIRRLPGSVANCDVKKLAPTVIEDGYAAMLVTGHAPATIRLTHALLLTALDSAVRDGLIQRNPADVATLPPMPKTKTPKALSDDDVKRLLAVAGAEPGSMGLLVRIALWTGMRRGEICGLTWGDVDLDAGVIHVRRSLSAYGSLLTVGPPKSSSGVRTVTMPDKLRVELAAIEKAEQPVATDPVVPGLDGGVLNPSSASRGGQRVLKRAGLSGFKLHSLRHTHATALVSSGGPLPAIARRLGHSNVTTTMSIYAHPKDGEDKALAAQIEKSLT